MLLEVPYPGRIVYAHVWRVNVGRMKLYLLDTDLDCNSEWDREITHKLYGGDWENRIKQEYLLGIGGILTMSTMTIFPSTWLSRWSAHPHYTPSTLLSPRDMIISRSRSSENILASSPPDSVSHGLTL